MSNPQLTPLLDFSRQFVGVGTPPAFLFTEDGHKLPTELLGLSFTARIAVALERIAEALPLVLKAQTSPDGVTKIEASMIRDAATVFLQVTHPSGAAASDYFELLSEVGRRAAVGEKTDYSVTDPNILVCAIRDSQAQQFREAVAARSADAVILREDVGAGQLEGRAIFDVHVKRAAAAYWIGRDFAVMILEGGQADAS